MASKDPGVWEHRIDSDNFNRLTIQGKDVELYIKAGGEKRTKTFSLSEVKLIRYLSNDSLLRFRKKGSLMPWDYECESQEERETIIQLLKPLLGNNATTEVKQNGFANSAKEAGIVIGIFALICNVVLVGAFLGTDPPNAGGAGTRGVRILKGIQGLAHGMGWIGIIIMNIILVGMWLGFTMLQAKSDHKIYTMKTG